MTVRLPLFALLAAAAATLPSFAVEPPSLDPRLVGTWHAERTDHYGESLIVRTTWEFTIRGDGSVAYQSVQTSAGEIGGRDVNKTEVLARAEGSLRQEGDALIATTTQGAVYRFRFRLSGNNGLVIDGKLFEKQ
jgi:hypothetical protein